jgi:hypothetical protein
MSYLSFFWTQAGRVPENTPVPWGVTANLLLRRQQACQFKLCFPKTGGGEDIAMCLDTVASGRLPLLSTPAAAVVHPWWNDGCIRPRRFFGWAFGDAELQLLYPQFTYRNFPNTVEMLMFSFISLLPGWLTLPQGAGLAICIALTAISSDLVHYLFVDDVACEWTGESFSLRRIVASILATWYKVHSELGNLASHLANLRFGCIFQRFDWHCGLQLNSKAVERKRAALRCFMVLCCTVCLMLVM